MDHAGHPHRRDVHTGLPQLVGVHLPLVAQDVRLVGDDEGGGQPLQLVEGGPQRRGVDLGPLRGVAGVGVPEPLHAVAGEVVALGELEVGRGVEVGVGHRVQQDLRLEVDPRALLVHEGEDGRHAAADRFAGDGDPRGVQAVFRAVFEDPLAHGVVLLDLGGVLRLGGPVVDREDPGRVRADGEFAEEAVVGLVVAEDPAGAVDVEHHRQRPRSALRTDDAGGDGAPGARVHVDPLLVDLGAGDTRVALQAEQDVPALLRRDLVDPGMRIRRLAQLFRRGFQIGGSEGEGQSCPLPVAGTRVPGSRGRTAGRRRCVHLPYGRTVRPRRAGAPRIPPSFEAAPSSATRSPAAGVVSGSARRPPHPGRAARGRGGTPTGQPHEAAAGPAHPAAAPRLATASTPSGARGLTRSRPGRGPPHPGTVHPPGDRLPGRWRGRRAVGRRPPGSRRAVRRPGRVLRRCGLPGPSAPPPAPPPGT